MVETGSINYDVPVTRRSVYSKLRALFRRQAIMQTASSYLFPWAIAEEVEKGLKQINSDKDGLPLPSHMQVTYSIFKYDEKISGKAIEQSARDALGRMLRNMKETVNKRVQSLFTGDNADDVKDPLASAKVATNRARATLRDARALSLMFALTDQLEAGFLAYEAFIEAKRDDITDFEKSVAQQTVKNFENSLNVQPKTSTLEPVAVSSES
jgi:hypothetical protein